MTSDAYKLLTTINAGGSSILSEALSAEFMIAIFGGNNYINSIITEMEIDYVISAWKPCDYMIYLPNVDDKVLVAVSVTRAMSHYDPDSYTLDRAQKLLIRKITNLVLARTGVHKHHVFTKSVLHVWCQTDEISKLVNQAFNDLDNDFKNGIALICTVTNVVRVFTNY